MTASVVSMPKVVFASHASGTAGGAERFLMETVIALKTDGRVEPVVTTPFEGALSAALREAAVRTAVLYTPWWTTSGAGQRLRRGRRLLDILRSARIWRRWLCAERPDLVVSNTAVIAAPALACFLTRTPHVWWIHEFVTRDHEVEYVLGEPFSQRLIGWSSRLVVANSHAVGNHYSPPIPARKLRVVYQGIEGLAPTPNESDGGPLRVLLLGRLARSKGVGVALEAASLLAAEEVPVCLRLVGPISPSFAEEVEALTAALDIGGLVELPGATAVPQSEYAWANVVLMCSTQEAFGRVTVEALKCGRPVVGTRSGGTVEILSEGVNGLLFEPGDAAGLAACLRRLVAEPGLLASLSQGAVESMSGRFTMSQEVEDIVALVQETVGA